MEKPSDLERIDCEFNYLQSMPSPFEYLNPHNIKGLFATVEYQRERRDHLINIRNRLLRIMEYKNPLMHLSKEIENLEALKVGLDAIEKVLKLLMDSKIQDEQVFTQFLNLRMSYINRIRLEVSYMFDQIINRDTEG